MTNPTKVRFGLIAFVLEGYLGACWFLGSVTVAVLIGSPSPGYAGVGDSDPSILGKVLDLKGKPIEGARVRLYRREGSWSHHDPQVEETRSGPDGVYRMNIDLAVPRPTGTLKRVGFVLLAEHPNHAIGWKTIPAGASKFRGDIRLVDERLERSVTVTDAAGEPIEGATVVAYGMSDPSSPRAELCEPFELTAADGPLTARTDALGKATITGLPRSNVSVRASKAGYAENFAWGDMKTLTLTPGATLEGTLSGPDGEPLGGVPVVLYAKFMWDFERTVTDEQGHYRLDGLKPKGWDMGAWQKGKQGDGSYAAWIDSPVVAVPTQLLTLIPNERQRLDLKAQPAGVIRVTLIEQGTVKRLRGVRIWGFDEVTGSSGRFNAYTDDNGEAFFFCTPSKVNLSIVGPPEGVFLDENLRRFPDAHVQLDFRGGNEDVMLIMPRIGGKLTDLSGLCKMPDGLAPKAVTVHAVRTGAAKYIVPRVVDSEGRFTIANVPAERNLGLYAVSEDGRFGGWLLTKPSAEVTPGPPIEITLRPTVMAERTMTDGAGQPLANCEIIVSPVVVETLTAVSRKVKSDDKGRIELDKIVPGLRYHLRKEATVRQRLPGGGFLVNRDSFDEEVILAP